LQNLTLFNLKIVGILEYITSVCYSLDNSNSRRLNFHKKKKSENLDVNCFDGVRYCFTYMYMALLRAYDTGRNCYTEDGVVQISSV
jgi:hypothetical protein